MADSSRAPTDGEASTRGRIAGRKATAGGDKVTDADGTRKILAARGETAAARGEVAAKVATGGGKMVAAGGSTLGGKN